MVEQINFSKVLLDVMLSFLLFAGAFAHRWFFVKDLKAETFLCSLVVGAYFYFHHRDVAFTHTIKPTGFDLDYIYWPAFWLLISINRSICARHSYKGECA